MGNAMPDSDYIVYTDGACSGNPGPGGWAAVIRHQDMHEDICGYVLQTTNQRMELQAAIEALNLIPPGSKVILHSDSAYLVNCFNDRWLDRWLLNGWKNSKGDPVENRDLWELLLELIENKEVSWVKVKGHGENELNNLCDKMAREIINKHKAQAENKEQDKVKPVSVMIKAGRKGENAKRRLGLLTGGGDCPGLNAVIRAVAKSSIYNYPYEVVGFNNGFKGLVENDAELLNDYRVSGILNRGGTILGTSNRDNPFNYNEDRDNPGSAGQDRSSQAISNLENWQIECLVVVGGDGTLMLAHRFSQLGVNIIGIPKTIDNDLPATDLTFGFDSAVSTATSAIDKIHTTAESHHRVMVVEVMGRNAGWIALQAGMAGGGDIILIPEIPFDFDHVAAKVLDRKKKGKKFSIIVVAEGAFPIDGEPFYRASGNVKRLGGIGQLVSDQIEKMTGMESRATVLGHLQRGGSPTAYDRVLATRFGAMAVELFTAGLFNKMVCLKGNRIEAVDLAEAVQGVKLVDPQSEQVKAAIAVGTSFGKKL